MDGGVRTGDWYDSFGYLTSTITEPSNNFNNKETYMTETTNTEKKEEVYTEEQRRAFKDLQAWCFRYGATIVPMSVNSATSGPSIGLRIDLSGVAFEASYFAKGTDTVTKRTVKSERF